MGGGLVDSTQRLRRGWAQPSDAAESPPRLWGDCRSRLVRTHCTSSTFARAMLQPSGRSISSDRVTRERHNRTARPRQFTFGFLVRVGARLVFVIFGGFLFSLSPQKQKQFTNRVRGCRLVPRLTCPSRPLLMTVPFVCEQLLHVFASAWHPHLHLHGVGDAAVSCICLASARAATLGACLLARCWGHV